MPLCKVCGMPLGSNPDCKGCLNTFIARETGKEKKGKRARQAPRKGEVWLMHNARKAPDSLNNCGTVKL